MQNYMVSGSGRKPANEVYKDRERTLKKVIHNTDRNKSFGLNPGTIT